MPKTQKSITASAAVDVPVSGTVYNTVSYNEPGGMVGGVAGTNPATVSFGSMGAGAASNLSVFASASSTNVSVMINNGTSTLGLDMGFVGFSLNVKVPAGGKATVKYGFSVTGNKYCDSIEGSSVFGLEFFHFGTGDKTTGNSPVDVTTLNFSTSSASCGESVIRLDGGTPTQVFSTGCPPYQPTAGDIANHAPITYGYSSWVSGQPVASPLTDTYTTPVITYLNDTASDITFKEYFGFMGYAGKATGCCHLLTANMALTSSDITFEKVNKPTAGTPNTAAYDGNPKTFTVNNTDPTKCVLAYVKHTDLKGTETTLYEYDTIAGAVIKGTNPVSGGVFSYTNAGKYTLGYKPVGAVWNASPFSPDSTTEELQYIITPKLVNKPAVATGDSGGKTYTGASQTFTLTMSGGLSATTWANLIKPGAAGIPAGVTDNNNGSFAVTDSDSYTFQLLLKDESNTAWSGATWNATAWDSGSIGSAANITLTVKPYEPTTTLSCNKTNGGNWQWNMGEKNAEVTVNLSDFFLATDADDKSADKVSFIYYYKDSSGAETPLSADTETYDPTAKTVAATVKMPDSLPKGSYTFGVKVDDSAGNGKNYVLKTNQCTKAFTVDSKGFDPSVLLWTYNEDGSASNKTLAQGGGLKYKLKSDGTAVAYAPQIVLKNDTYDHTATVALDGTYSGDVTKSAACAGTTTYSINIKLKMLDSNSKFANSTSASYISVSADGKTATVTLKWKIEKGDFDLSGIKWIYEYTDAEGNNHSGEYDPADPPQYNDGFDISVRIDGDSLPDGLTLAENPDGTLVWAGDSKDSVGTYKTTFDIVYFDYDSSSFNAPDATDPILTLDWEIAKKNIYKAFKAKQVNYSNANGSGKFFIQYMPVDSAYESFLKYEYKDSLGNTVTLAQIEAAADPKTVQTYTVEVSIDTSVAGSGNVELTGGPLTKTFETGSNKDGATVTIGGEDGSTPITATYDGDPHFGGTSVVITSDKGLNIKDFTLTYYTGKTPDPANALPAGEVPTDAGEYCLEIVLTGPAASKYILIDDTFPLTIEKQKAEVKVDGVSDLSKPFEATYDGSVHGGLSSIVLTDGSGNPFTDYTVVYYKDSIGAGNALAAGEEPKAAGKYVAQIVFGTASAGNYELSADTFTVEIAKQKIAVPQVTGTITFNAKAQNLTDFLDGNYKKYFDLGVIEPSGQYAGLRNAGSYTAYLTITDPNYCWDYGAANMPVKFALTDGEFTVTGNYVQADYNWSIVPFVLTGSSLWNTKGKEGASLNLPEWVGALVSEGSLSVDYRYYEDTASAAMENPELKAGNSYWVDAALSGDDADNFVFDSGTQVSAKTTYNVPKGGFASLAGNALSFVKSNWLWFVIALAVLLFLIILICIIRHRRKTREERAEKKAAEKEKKEEEKRRKEEERIRKEEEREAAKQKQQAELELQKAKQEAELAKIKAQAGMGAGMAAMAMAQPQAQQMPYQAPAQAQPPMQQQLYPQMPSYQPPAQQPAMQRQPYPQYPGGELAEIKAELTRLRELRETDREFAAMRTEHRTDRELSAMKTELEMAKMQNGYGSPRMMQPYTGGQTVDADMLAEKFGHMMATMLKSMGMPLPAVAPREIAQSVEESKPVSVAYPPDAVVTTTTTVDTTKNAVPVRSREDDLRALDIDGFYDTFEEK